MRVHPKTFEKERAMSETYRAKTAAEEHTQGKTREAQHRNHVRDDDARNPMPSVANDPPPDPTPSPAK